MPQYLRKMLSTDAVILCQLRKLKHYIGLCFAVAGPGGCGPPAAKMVEHNASTLQALHGGPVRKARCSQAILGVQATRVPGAGSDEQGVGCEYRELYLSISSLTRSA
jgi:hypothetical protein